MATTDAGSRTTAIITGAASGIGLQLTELLVSRGMFVAMVDLNGDKVKEQADRLNAVSSGSVTSHQLDTTNKEGTKAFLSAFVAEHGRIDLFFPNAGVSEYLLYPLPEQTKDEGATAIFEPNLTTLEVDLIAPIYSAGLVLQYMHKQSPGPDGTRGKVIFTASVFGLWPSAYLPMYQTAKHGLVGYTRSWGQASKAYGITVNAVLPSFTPTAVAPAQVFEGAAAGGFLTPIKAVIDAFKRFIDHPELSGVTTAVSMGDAVDVAPPPVINAELEQISVYLSNFVKEAGLYVAPSK